ncbi:MAG: hypothetical protein WCV93_01200 [Candidatus Shapirobacteria bacterium]|jgi:hypothetical protein
MDRNKEWGYIETMNWWKKIKQALLGKKRDKWVEDQIRGMAKLKGRLVL